MNYDVFFNVCDVKRSSLYSESLVVMAAKKKGNDSTSADAPMSNAPTYPKLAIVPQGNGNSNSEKVTADRVVGGEFEVNLADQGIRLKTDIPV